MPNSRSQQKRGISVYVPKGMKEALAEEAKRQHIPLSELVTKIYADAIGRFGIKNPKTKHHE